MGTTSFALRAESTLTALVSPATDDGADIGPAGVAPPPIGDPVAGASGAGLAGVVPTGKEVNGSVVATCGEAGGAVLGTCVAGPLSAEPDNVEPVTEPVGSRAIRLASTSGDCAFVGDVKLGPLTPAFDALRGKPLAALMGAGDVGDPGSVVESSVSRAIGVVPMGARSGSEALAEACTLRGATGTPAEPVGLSVCVATPSRGAGATGVGPAVPGVWPGARSPCDAAGVLLRGVESVALVVSPRGVGVDASAAGEVLVRLGWVVDCLASGVGVVSGPGAGARSPCDAAGVVCGREAVGDDGGAAGELTELNAGPPDAARSGDESTLVPADAGGLPASTRRPLWVGSKGMSRSRSTRSG